MSLNSARVLFPIKAIQAGGVVDGHMHINSGSCAPLPLLYGQASMLVGHVWKLQERETLEGLMSLMGFVDGIEIQKLSTDKLGARIADINKFTYQGITNSIDFNATEKKQSKNKKPPRELSDKELEKQSTKKEAAGQIVTPMILAPMDMERAHIAGYNGSMIYHGEKNDLIFYQRSDGKALEKDGKKVSLAHEYDKSKGLKLHQWERQSRETKSAAKLHPFHEIPLYFYDPRRWKCPLNEPISQSVKDNLEYGTWADPFKNIATESQQGLFVGFKMYPPLGHQPLDELCEYLPEYYDRCETENLPILTHCSPGGMTTHEAKFYGAFDGSNQTQREDARKRQYEKLKKLLTNKGRATPTFKPGEEINVGFDDTDPNHRAAMDYFFKNYVHPEAWRKVLTYFPKLHLCLAHFGGDEWQRGKKEDWSDDVPSEWIRCVIELTGKYDNAYTDFSCFDLDKDLVEGNGNVSDSFGSFLRKLDLKEYKHLRKKIIFGTDWYLTLLTRKIGGAYGYYCGEFKKFLDKIDETLWVRFTLVNPWELYGLGNKKKMENMAEALKFAKADKKNTYDQLEKFKKVNEEVQKIKDDLALWDRDQSDIDINTSGEQKGDYSV